MQRHSMETTVLGNTGLTVSRSAFGALPIQRRSKRDAAALLRRAQEAGINFFDTARAYSDSEEKMALGLGDVRERIVIATKTHACAPEEFWAHLEASLGALGAETIDIYQFHNPAEVPMADSPMYRCMLEARAQGKIRHIGISCHLLANARAAMESGLYATIQYPLSILSDPSEMAFARECGERGIGVIAMKALCGGLLTSAAPSMALLRGLPHVVPIWGFQHDHELDEVLALERDPPALDEAMRARIEKDRAGLAGDFCRGCGYCLPCAAQIQINTCARMPLLLRRAVYQNFLTPYWRREMERIEGCTGCGLCSSRCPYKLDAPRLLRAAWADYRAFDREHG
ncbi:MAG: aldo/keto reductase [Clostridia bacterium]|nr:aldo/keto reductase [Clostridia bacterium]